MKTPRPCPVCDNRGDRRVLHTMKFYEGVLGDGYDVVVCAQCGAGFADGIPEQAELDRYYAEQSKYTYSGSGGAESEYDMRRFEIIADHVSAYFPSKEARILDVGCATGGLLSVFKRRGYKNLLGADPSPACAEAARRLYDIEVRTSTIAQVETWQDSFDLITLVGVLEHVREARSAVQSLNLKLTPTGALCLAVPDVEGLMSAHNAPFSQFSMEHLNFFSETSLSNMMVFSGYQKIRAWHDVVEWRENVSEPVVAGLYEAQKDLSVRSDQTTAAALTAYIEGSLSDDCVLQRRIEALVRDGRPIFVWGAGALTRRLLEISELGHANIVAYIDSNPYLQNSTLGARKILPPSTLVGRDESILICSVAFKNEITHTIRKQLSLPNTILWLDSESASYS